MNQDIKLSVLLLAYNHESYIRQSLESILMQKVNFDYEVIVLEDCSTDDTRKIILEYKDRFKNIKLFFNKKNYGGGFTHRIGKKYADKKYVSILEGDDYWTDDNKLQQQVDFLDKNPDFVGCASNTELLYEKDGKKEPMIPNSDKLKTVCGIVDLISGYCYFHTSSYVWRNIFKDTYPKEHHYNKYMGDWFLSMLYARHGNIGYIDKIMSCYRIHEKGVWTRLPEYVKQISNIRGMYIYNKLLNYKYNEEFKRVWWSCKDVIRSTPKNYRTFSSLTKIYLLKKSIDVTANKNFLTLFDKIKNSLNRKLSYRITQLKIYRFFIKIFLSLGKRLDKIIMKFFEFLFNCLYFFDINRYYLYYKIKFYQFFKINIYFDEKYLENNLIITADSQ